MHLKRHSQNALLGRNDRTGSTSNAEHVFRWLALGLHGNMTLAEIMKIWSTRHQFSKQETFIYDAEMQIRTGLLAS